MESYGLHLNSDGVYWLLQQNESLNALGLPNKQSPFRLKSNLLMCPHKFDLSVNTSEYSQEIKVYEKLLERNEVLQFLDPQNIPERKVLYVETDSPKNYHALTQLQGLLNPCVSVANPGSVCGHIIDTIVRRLRSSNLSTYMIYAVDSFNLRLISDLTTIASSLQTRLILAGPRSGLYNLDTMMAKTKFEPELFDWTTSVTPEVIKNIGNIRLKRKMRT